MPGWVKWVSAWRRLESGWVGGVVVGGWYVAFLLFPGTRVVRYVQFFLVCTGPAGDLVFSTGAAAHH